MIIIAGWLDVHPDHRAEYLVGCTEVVRQAREATGCLDYALSADLADESRVNVYERWEDELGLLAFRGSGPADEQTTVIRDASVERYEISSSGPA